MSIVAEIWNIKIHFTKKITKPNYESSQSRPSPIKFKGKKKPLRTKVRFCAAETKARQNSLMFICWAQKNLYSVSRIYNVRKRFAIIN